MFDQSSRVTHLLREGASGLVPPPSTSPMCTQETPWSPCAQHTLPRPSTLGVVAPWEWMKLCPAITAPARIRKQAPKDPGITQGQGNPFVSPACCVLCWEHPRLGDNAALWILHLCSPEPWLLRRYLIWAQPHGVGPDPSPPSTKQPVAAMGGATTSPCLLLGPRAGQAWSGWPGPHHAVRESKAQRGPESHLESHRASGKAEACLPHGLSHSEL